MEYKEINERMLKLRCDARMRDRYFKDEDYEWIIGIDIFNTIRYNTGLYYAESHVSRKDLKIMNIPATVDYDRLGRMDLFKNTTKLEKIFSNMDVASMYPKNLYITTASRPDDGYMNKYFKNMLNSAYGKDAYFEPKFKYVELEDEMVEYCKNDVAAIMEIVEHEKKYKERNKMKIEKVIFNDPATIVFRKDGTKTVVKAQGELFDPEKGLAMAISKKALGNQGNYFEEFKKWLPVIE